MTAYAATEGPRRDCQCPRTRHQHGDRNAYVVDKCRCNLCRAANRAAENQRAKDKAYGRYNPGRVDATPVREHLLMLREYGIGIKQTAQLAGVSNATLGKIIYGDPANNVKPRKRVATHVADRVLAIQPRLENLRPGVRVDNTGTWRRLEALVAIGWSQQRLANMLGIQPGNFLPIIRGDRDVTARTALAVRDLYNQCWDQPQPAPGAGKRAKASASRAKRMAARRGWVPPLAWDDEAIDDPEAAPHQPQPPQRGNTSQNRVEDLEFLLEAGVGMYDIQRQLDVSYMALKKDLERSGRHDLAGRITAMNTATTAEKEPA